MLIKLTPTKHKLDSEAAEHFEIWGGGKGLIVHEAKHITIVSKIYFALFVRTTVWGMELFKESYKIIFRQAPPL